MKKSMRKVFRMLLTVIALVSLTAAPVSAATTEKSYYAIGDWNGYTNPDENYVLKDMGNDIYELTVKIPASKAGTPHAYKITNGTWDADGCWGLDTYTHPNNPYPEQAMGSIQFDLAKESDVSFYFNAKTNAVADSTYFVLMTPYIVGDFFEEAGVGKDWQAEDSTLLLKDDEWDGIYEGTFTIPAGDYAFKITNGKSWDESYGVDGATTGMDTNMKLSYKVAMDVTFAFNSVTKVTTITKEVESKNVLTPVKTDTAKTDTAKTDTTADTTAADVPKTSDHTAQVCAGLCAGLVIMAAAVVVLKKKEIHA
jgi:hypothetical protein